VKTTEFGKTTIRPVGRRRLAGRLAQPDRKKPISMTSPYTYANVPAGSPVADADCVGREHRE